MNTNKNKKNSSSHYRDFVSFEPDIVKLLNKNERELIGEHSQIIESLRGKNMTVKEIHKLFYNDQTKSYKFNIKTIYRYLEKLEKTGLIAVAGHRMTDDSRKTEKLYRRTAYVFFPQKEEVEWWEKEEGKQYSNKLRILIEETLKGQEIDTDEFYTFFKEYSVFEDQMFYEFFEKTQENKILADLFSQTEIDEITKLSVKATMFISLLKKPELFEKMRASIKFPTDGGVNHSAKN